jgi:hypothetical protein
MVDACRNVPPELNNTRDFTAEEMKDSSRAFTADSPPLFQSFKSSASHQAPNKMKHCPLRLRSRTASKCRSEPKAEVFLARAVSKLDGTPLTKSSGDSPTSQDAAFGDCVPVNRIRPGAGHQWNLCVPQFNRHLLFASENKLYRQLQRIQIR